MMLEAFTVLGGLVGIGALVWLMVAVARVESNYDGGALCAPSRRAAVTASVPQEQRRIAYPVPPPYTFDTRPRLVPAQTYVSITPAPAPQRTRRAVPVTVPVAPPIAVPEWPTRQTVEQPAQVAVNRTAARFGSLEIKRD